MAKAKDDQQSEHDAGRELRDGMLRIRQQQVREVQLAMMRGEPRARRIIMMEALHRPWIDKLRAEHNWPVDSMVEMLLLTEGDEEEIDRQLSRWRAQTNGMGPGSMRDYQQFTSILHAQHQQRLHPISDRDASQAIEERYAKLSADGSVVARAPASQVEAVQQRLLTTTHAEKLVSIVRQTQLSPAVVVEAYQAVAHYKNPTGRLLSLWESWRGSNDNFPAYVRNEVRKHLGEQP